MTHSAPLLSVLLLLSLCVSVASPGVTGKRSPPAENDEAERSEVRRRLVAPGTLWCGFARASSFDDLGVFAETDSCCREHDQCNRTIPSLQSQFGVFNNYSFTMSHCDCDNKFHRCLSTVTELIARVVGRIYFNLVKTRCFDFSRRLQCTGRDRFGMCRFSNVSLYAVVKPAMRFDSPTATEVGLNATEALTSNATAAAASASPPEGLAGP